MPVQVSVGAGSQDRRSPMEDLDRRRASREPGAAGVTSAGPRTPRRPGMRRPVPSRWAALALLASAQLMLVLDVTVVNVALPDIGAALHLHRAELPWVMTAYTLVFGGLALQGLGAALMSPAALATVMTLFPGPSRAKALGVWSALAGAGSALGVILGGL